MLNKKSDKTEIDVKTLTEVISNLEKQVRDLDIRKSNLEADIHQRTVKLEYDQGNDRNELIKSLNNSKKEVQKQSEEFLSRLRKLELSERQYNDRLIQLQNREKDVSDFNKTKLEFEERVKSFKRYRLEKEKEFEDLQIKIVEGQASLNHIKEKEENLKNRENVLRDKEIFYNEKLGELNHKIKEFELQRLNYLEPKMEAVG